MGPTHGLPSTYNAPHKCRCDVCKKAHSKRMREQRARRIAYGLANPDRIPHGTSGGLTNWGCTCIPCTVAHSVAQKARRDKR